jgi:hypothetical protein
MRTFNNYFHPLLVASIMSNQSSDFLVRLCCYSAIQYPKKTNMKAFFLVQKNNFYRFFWSNSISKSYEMSWHWSFTMNNSLGLRTDNKRRWSDTIFQFSRYEPESLVGGTKNEFFNFWRFFFPLTKWKQKQLRFEWTFWRVFVSDPIKRQYFNNLRVWSCHNPMTKCPTVMVKVR